MAKSNKPVIWLPFAAGGTVAAFVLPVMMLLTLLVAAGVGAFEEAFTYQRMQAFAGHWLGKLVLFIVLVLPLWHAAHRLRMTLQDLGVRRPGTRALVARVCYAGAAVATLILLYSLWLVG